MIYVGVLKGNRALEKYAQHYQWRGISGKKNEIGFFFSISLGMKESEIINYFSGNVFASYEGMEAFYYC
jgi:hypothetical protein